MFARSGHTSGTTIGTREVKGGPALGVHDFIISSFVDGHGRGCGDRNDRREMFGFL